MELVNFVDEILNRTCVSWNDVRRIIISYDRHITALQDFVIYGPMCRSRYSWSFTEDTHSDIECKEEFKNDVDYMPEVTESFNNNTIGFVIILKDGTSIYISNMNDMINYIDPELSYTLRFIFSDDKRTRYTILKERKTIEDNEDDRTD